MNEQFIDALKTFGTIVLNGTGDETEATKALEQINVLLVENPNVFPIIQDENNRKIFEQVKESIAKINFETIGILDAPKLMALIPLAKQVNFYN